MKKILFLLSVILTPLVTMAQEDLEKKIQNPIANLVSLPFQNNTDFNDGGNTNVLNIQPVTPFGLGDNMNLIVRTIVPIISAPGIPDRQNGVGNIILSGFFTPVTDSKLIWGIGPAVQFGTLTDGLGTKKTSLAPGAVLLYQNNGWTIGGIFQNFWGVAGDGPKYNLFYCQVFAVKSLVNGWYINSAPIITANWEADDDKWTIPVGAGVGRLIKAGKLPINCQVGYYHYLENPTNASGQLRVQVVMILPKFY